ncbi:MAG: hypothetical protein ABIP30_15595 [Ferruginibacter sp.]
MKNLSFFTFVAFCQYAMAKSFGIGTLTEVKCIVITYTMAEPIN